MWAIDPLNTPLARKAKFTVVVLWALQSNSLVNVTKKNFFWYLVPRLVEQSHEPMQYRVMTHDHLLLCTLEYYLCLIV